MSEVEQEQTQEQDGPEPDATPGEPTPDEQDEVEEAHESEQVEGVPAEEGEQPEASQPAGTIGEKELEKMFRRVDTANATYRKRLVDIMEAEAGVLEPCPRCNEPFLGLIFPPMMKPVSDEQKAAVLVSIGEAAPLATLKDPYARRCDTCDGNGVTLSGSRLNQYKAIRCKPCGGKGYIGVGMERADEVAQPAETVALNGGEASVEQAPSVDLWGRPAGHPDYGVHPQYVGAR